MIQNNELCELKVTYSRPLSSDKYQVNSSNDAERYIRKAYDSSTCQIELKEYFFVLLLNRNNNVIGFHKLSEGGITTCTADIRLTFGIALKSTATSLILCHNHPSGNLQPSVTDINLTNQFVEAGKIMDIQVLDHIILTKNSYYSFMDAKRIDMPY